MNFTPAFGTIAQAIQLAIAPVFMLAGIGSLLNVLASRLSRVIDRARQLEALHPRSTGPEHDRHVWELRLLDRRITMINRGLAQAVSSAVMVCLVVVLMFVASLVKWRLGTWVAASFILAMLFLIASLVTFLFEVRLSLHAIHVRDELLEHDDDDEAGSKLKWLHMKRAAGTHLRPGNPQHGQRPESSSPGDHGAA